MKKVSNMDSMKMILMTMVMGMMLSAYAFADGDIVKSSIIVLNGTGTQINGGTYLLGAKCSPGQVLTSDATTGLVSCIIDQTVAANTGWGVSGLNVYNATANIGIGTTAPNAK